MAETALIDTMRYLGIEHDDASDNIKMNRVKQVADYFGQFDDGMEMLRRVAVKLPRAQRVDGVLEYARMRKEHDSIAKDNIVVESKLQESKRKAKELRGILESLE